MFTIKFAVRCLVYCLVEMFADCAFSLLFVVGVLFDSLVAFVYYFALILSCWCLRVLALFVVSYWCYLVDCMVG